MSLQECETFLNGQMDVESFNHEIPNFSFDPYEGFDNFRFFSSRIKRQILPPEKDFP